MSTNTMDGNWFSEMDVVENRRIKQKHISSFDKEDLLLTSKMTRHGTMIRRMSCEFPCPLHDLHDLLEPSK